MGSLELAYEDGDVVRTLPSPTMRVRAVGRREGEAEAGGVVFGVCGAGEARGGLLMVVSWRQRICLLVACALFGGGLSRFVRRSPAASRRPAGASVVGSGTASKLFFLGSPPPRFRCPA